MRFFGVYISMNICRKDNEDFPTPLDAEFDSCLHCRVALAIHSSFLSNEELESVLSPNGWPKPTRPKRRNPASEEYRKSRGIKGNFIVDSDQYIQSNDLRHHINWVCDWVETSAELQNQINDLRNNAVISCYWWSKYGLGGPALWPEHLARLARIGVEVQINFTDYSDDEE